MLPLIQSFVSHFSAVACSLKPGVGGQLLGIPQWYKYLQGEVIAGRCTPQFAFPGDLTKVLFAVIEILLRVSAMVAVGFVIYGGYRFILSQGEPDQTNAARSTIINALIGLVIVVSATVIVTFVFNSVAKY